MYAKLILRNARRSIKDYLIYIVTMTICVMLFYAFLSISSAYYHPQIGTEYNLNYLSDGMKLAICFLSLLLLFLIGYVNNYMLRRRQKEFAVQTVIGMEQKTVAWLFFAETFVMGAVSMVLGIALGMLCSQFITAMLLSSFGQPFRLSLMLFLDTVLLTVCFFTASFLFVGFWNVRRIQNIKIIDMIHAESRNEESVKKSRFLPVMTILYELVLIMRLFVGMEMKYYYFDARYALPVHVMFWGNILAPAAAILISALWLLKQRKWRFNGLVTSLMGAALVNASLAASVPGLRLEYLLSFDSGTNNKYLLFLLLDFIYLICAFFYLSGNMILAWKESNPEHKYTGENLFLFGQILSKLKTTTKTMTLICLTLVLSIFLFLSMPALVGWASGYLDIRSVFDVQIGTRYNNVYEQSELPRGNYDLVTDFLNEYQIETEYDCILYLYLPKAEEFHNRVKYDFPEVAISLSDYNRLMEMRGYDPISLGEDEFTTQWKSIATEEERNTFLETHKSVMTDAGTLQIAKRPMWDYALGEMLYNSYTDVIYVFPDAVCEKLLPVMRNRYIKTEKPLPYDTACALEETFTNVFPEEGEGVCYCIRTSTRQINSTKASNFVLQASMTYGAVVLMVICFTILSLQQLSDAAYYKYRFGVLQKLGVEEEGIHRLIIKQLVLWFGLPILTAVLVSVVVILYFFQMISAQLVAYVGYKTLLMQVGITTGILVLLFLCYFTSTWILFQRAVRQD